MDLLLERSRASLLKQLDRVNRNHGNKAVPQAAQALGIDPAIVKAIIAIETGGAPITLGNSIKFLFMIGRHFTPKYKKKFPNRPLPAWANARMSGKRSVLRDGIRLWPHGAYANTSWGIFQIHGWSYRKLGYGSPGEMVAAFKRSEDAQIRGFIDFVRTKPRLYTAIKNKDWYGIGYYYNGDRRGKYARWMQTVYNAASPNNQDNSRIASSRRGYNKMKQTGQIGTASAGTGAVAPGSGGRIVLIGDSNAAHINREYKKYYESRGGQVLALHRNGSGANYWIEVLSNVTSGRSGGNKHAKQILQHGVTQIHCTSLGGNDGGRAYKDSTLKAYIERKIKPLMQLMAKYPGSTFAGPVPVGAKRTYKDMNSNVLRAKMNNAMAAAAREVGIAFWNPHGEYSYDPAALDSRKDDVHITSRMAKQEFGARQGFLGGQAVASAGASSAVIAQNEKEADAQRRMQDWKRNTQIIQNLMKHKDQIAKMGPPTAKQVKAAIAQAKAAQNAAEPDSLGGDETIVPLPSGNKGRVLAKYVDFLKKHQPDFDFDKFYKELDVYLKSVKKDDMLKKRDYVFGEEHYDAYILVRDIKDRESNRALAENLRMLKNLVNEVRMKW